MTAYNAFKTPRQLEAERLTEQLAAVTRERDEALAHVDRLRDDFDAAVANGNRVAAELREAKAEVKRLEKVLWPNGERP